MVLSKRYRRCSLRSIFFKPFISHVLGHFRILTSQIISYHLILTNFSILANHAHMQLLKLGFHALISVSSHEKSPTGSSDRSSRTCALPLTAFNRDHWASSNNLQSTTITWFNFQPSFEPSFKCSVDANLNGIYYWTIIKITWVQIIVDWRWT